ncbi:tetratricopeptide repeat protein [Pseudomonas sp. B21-053]|uniref:tetratricopeptide repeat protein n=1 Tax=Pseudomonas sp. B21-053 TaxID=2895493 RepID=UPI00222EC4B7|nr:tetratricopeptide repeat protein [Pseudomonas sp. B21-053]UZE13984.1 tetratricopeptide repeat protein [Pseudomonas sp. B21-053]
MGELAVAEWTLEGVLEEMKHIHHTMKDRQFAFILGAGASFTSGIPTGQDLARKWLTDLHLRECADGRSLHQWIAGCGVGVGELNWQTAAQHYPQIFERRFEGDREAGYAELEAAMEGKSPSLGYSLLAEIIQHTRHKVVVTTNFDNLVADALAMHAHQSPLVVAHESLAGFVRPQMRRPLVAKIHRDLYLHPINDPAGVSTMEQGWKIALKKLFQYFTPVVVGYGGNDGSLMDMLMGLEEGDIAGRMIWCYRDGSPPPEKALGVLSKHRGLLVKIPGFDQFMLQLAAKLVTDFDVAAIAERTAKLGQERAVRYRDQASKLSEDSLTGSPAEQRAGEVLTQSVRSGQSWWAWEIRAKAETDFEKRNRIYLQGIKRFPNSPELAGNYAIFLKNSLKDYDAAETMYLKAMELDPLDPTYVGNYASFLAHQRNNYDAAESFYKKSLELDPNNSANIGNYATFQADIRNNFGKADELYKKAIELDPKNVNNFGNYAIFLKSQLKEYDTAETMYKRTLELDPSNAGYTSSYANYLSDQRGDYNAAEELYKRAIELDPSHADYIGCYANFLADQRKDYDAAEKLYKKALELDPQNANNVGNYANFLEDQRGDYDAAEKMYEKAIELDADHASNKRNYASFLENHRKSPM